MRIMTPREVLERVGGFPLRVFEPGEVVISAAGAAGELLFLSKGTVEVAIEDVVIVRVSEPGSVFGEIALLLDQPHTAAVTAVQPSSFRVVDDPQAFFEAEPQVAIYIAQILARRLNAVNHLLVDARRRIAQTDEPAGLVMDALRRMGHALQHHEPM
jgi:CRP/FNR family cyclic AMP-dependent transcriptional regulator